MQQMQVFIYCKITLHVSGCLTYPSSGVHQTVTAASGTGHITYQGNDILRVWPNLGHASRRSLPWYVIWPVPEFTITVWCTPDDGCDRHPSTCRVILQQINTCICCILLDLINIELLNLLGFPVSRFTWN